MVSDELGRDEFMTSFRKYVEKRSEITFFDEQDFSFSNSKSKALIQIADIVAGTIAYNYEPKKEKSK